MVSLRTMMPFHRKSRKYHSIYHCIKKHRQSNDLLRNFEFRFMNMQYEGERISGFFVSERCWLLAVASLEISSFELYSKSPSLSLYLAYSRVLIKLDRKINQHFTFWKPVELASNVLKSSNRLKIRQNFKIKLKLQPNCLSLFVQMDK